MWVADYGCFLVYETPDGSGEFHRFENRDQVENFLEKREEVRHLKSPADHFKSPIQPHGALTRVPRTAVLVLVRNLVKNERNGTGVE